jgi:uncharacterized protein
MENLLTCEWRKVAFANYIVPPEVVKKYLPAHTKLDFYNGNCFMSLVGFKFKNVAIAGVKVPHYSDFEEINLRFYVKRFDGSKWRKGTVFISQIVNKSALGIFANILVRENYQVLPTSCKTLEGENALDVKYSWTYKKEEQHLRVKSDRVASPFTAHSESAFILDRFYGYGKIDEKTSNEYGIAHSSWHTYTVNEYSIHVDFARQFGAEFSMLSSMTPHSVLLTEGSKVEIKNISKIKS